MGSKFASDVAELASLRHSAKKAKAAPGEIVCLWYQYVDDVFRVILRPRGAPKPGRLAGNTFGPGLVLKDTSKEQTYLGCHVRRDGIYIRVEAILKPRWTNNWNTEAREAYRRRHTDTRTLNLQEQLG